MDPKPIFPLRLISLTDDTVREFSTLDEALGWLEIWDSDDPTYAEDALILDRYNRRVRLKIEGMRLLLLELYDPTPLSEEIIHQIVEQSRQRWQASRGKSFWARLWQWLTSFFKRK
jgi:hypothetical protein